MIPPLNGRCYQRIRQVDIGGVLPLVPEIAFVNTGGTNGWVAKPRWLPEFFKTLDIPGRVTFACARMLPAYQGIPPHVDLWENLPNIGRRFHVPLATHPDVKMRWPDDSVEVHMEAGWLYEVEFHRLHEVVHLAPVPRVHVHYNVVG